MTIIVGILCSDGVVIGSDSAMAAGRATTGYTIERQDGDVFKIELVDEGRAITAISGAMGLAQRFNDNISNIMQTLRQPLRMPSSGQIEPKAGVSTLLMQFLYNNLPNGAVPYDEFNPVQLGVLISQMTIAEFARTQSHYQNPNGLGLGALFAFVHKGVPHLVEFDTAQFHPELKGLPDPARGDHDRNWRCASMGMGSKLADAFLAHAYRLLFDSRAPTVSRAKLVVTWAIDHAARYTPGLVGGDTHLAVIEKMGGIWTARHVDTGETKEQLVDLEKYISDFGKQQNVEYEEKKTKIDLNKELFNK